MDLKKHDARFRLKYSKQAVALLENLDDDFSVEAFERWVEKNMFVVGDGYVTAYLVQKKKLNDNILESLKK